MPEPWAIDSDELIYETTHCVALPCCGFTMDAGHTDNDTGTYSCPACGENAAAAERDRYRQALERIRARCNNQGGWGSLAWAIGEDARAALDLVPTNQQQEGRGG